MTDLRPTACAARPGADQQMRCTRCGLVWDIDDPEPPTCRDEPVPKPKAKKPRKARAQLVALAKPSKAAEALYNETMTTP